MREVVLSGRKMWLPDHWGECLSAVLDGEYSYPREKPEAVHTIVDVGCNVGSFIVWACERWWPKQITRVWAYDPNREAVALAMRNTEGCAEVIDFTPAAITTNPDPWFDHNPDWGSASTLSGGHWKVHGIHPKHLPPADVLKIDCEGCDLEVLENYPYLATVKVLMFEHHRLAHREPMMRIAREAGFVMRRGFSGETETDTQAWCRP